ncbi:hypothetical protein HRR83_006617 [Exophiala dermatitidis]|uniref:NTF2-like domain-containing protein n=2 Tax=Exophiala dermatitidis TaxID=5970 RepID=H6BW33_EXODN|nr:uncharacterized protein HMPREF1120_04110 [Exophiala dermatitidis NIH/UT8656]KAJ4511369.1 hypothetical protein HRR75_005295 [Exophiala dermatitidis]EHY56004.1 hypothetical protein HMPREF1120_04110 [Exophiala dermatitidis NIH/UT8656]KAJ4514118.1 hypothetical protein HRR74_005777 [Exophiala dermatitidis]KAJ4515398.1 hypothetical protein HRR73_005229 [Exophiala dermatitidis]KAJ4533767.1 hypothetical protein HRR77_008252 [Exophiala dermatitidis]
MKPFSLLAPFAIVASVASSALPKRDGNCYSDCLSQGQAESIVNQYISILTHTNVTAANATAQALLDENYTEISDSILSLEGLPLGNATFVGKQEYINGVLSAQGVEGVNTLEILVAGCTKILWYWLFTGIGTGQYEVKGFNLFTLSDAGQIAQVNLEFNSIAWGLDTGYQVIPPAGGGSPTRK